MEKNATEILVIPETPRAANKQAITVYVPIASYDNVGIARFDPKSFVVQNGEVSLRRGRDIDKVIVDFSIDKDTGIATLYYDDGSSATINFPVYTGEGAVKTELIQEVKFSATPGSFSWEYSDSIYVLLLSLSSLGITGNCIVIVEELVDGDYVNQPTAIIKREDTLLLQSTEPFDGRLLIIDSSMISRINNLENGSAPYSLQMKHEITPKDRRNFAYGMASFAGGHSSKAYQKDTFVFGGSNVGGNADDPDSYSFAFVAGGNLNKALSWGAFIGGGQEDVVSGYNSGTIGYYNKIYADYSQGIGDRITINSDDSTKKEGWSQGVGRWITISNDFVQALGQYITAKAPNSLAVGNQLTIEKLAENTQMFGRYLRSDTANQQVLGHHNLRDENALFIVGNGEENSGDKETSITEQGQISFHRRNAMTIKKNGAFHTDSRVTNTNLPVVEYYVENGVVKKRVVEGQYDKEIFHIRNLSFGDTSVDLVIDKDGTLLFKTLNHNKENGLGEGYSFKQLTVDKYGRVVLAHTVTVDDENPVILDIKNYSSPVSQLKVKANGQLVGRHLTQDEDEDGTLTTKDFVLRKISENGGSGGKTYYKYNCEIASEDWSYWGKFSFISSQTGITLNYVLKNPRLITGLSIAIHNQENTEHFIGIIHDIGTYNNKPKLTIRTNEGFLAYNLNTEMGISTNTKVEL